jgi:TonB-linked SusC/RagA family outer membrane protein
MRKLLVRKLMLFLGILLGGITVSQAQTATITGRITDSAGNVVPAATVRIKGTRTASVADNEGKFSIKAAAGDVLVFSSSGVATKEVRVKAGVNNLDVHVGYATQNLAEVTVTTALGVKRQARELGYSTAQIKAAELTQAAPINAATGLAAKVSGVDIRLADNGVNPQVKVTFRGNRSIEGSNSALIVVDGVPVDGSYLANLNPSDIADITILKGSNAAALYGMAASNGVMSVTTKKGKGKFSLTYVNTFSAQRISYFPQLQNEYSGYGGESAGPGPNLPSGGSIYYINPYTGLPNVVPFENEAYGVPYNSLDYHVDSIPIGINNAGQWVFVPFKANPNGRKDFFHTGIGDQNKLSGSFGNSWGGIYFSGEHTSQQGVVPKDRFDRSGGRINGNVNFGRFSASAGISYTSSTTDVAGNSYSGYRPVYWDVINQQPQIDLGSMKNLNLQQNNLGFVNAYYPNPWWQIDNSRSKNTTNQILTNLQLNYKFTKWLSVTTRGGYSHSSTNAPSYIDSVNWPSLLYNDAIVQPGQWFYSALNPGNVPYQSEDVKDHYDDLNGDLFATLTKEAGDFKFTLLAGGNYRVRKSYANWFSNQVNEGNIVGQNIIPSLYTKVTNPDGSANAVFSYERFDQSAYGDLVIGYDSWLFLHGSFRNDWTSILAPGSRSFSYPSVDLSAVLSDKLSFIKSSGTVSFLKVRAGYAGTGNVSLDGYTPLGVLGNQAGGTRTPFTTQIPNFGAYAIYPTATLGLGFPFGSVSGYSQNTQIVQNGLKPEKTSSVETGFQLGLFHNRINLEATYYDQVANNQTIPLQVSEATGVNSYLTNAGKVNNRGVELDLQLTPLVRIGELRFNLGMNFAWQNSKVINIAGGSAELDQINYGTTSLGGIFAIKGKAYPQIMTTDFNRDPQGRIIVSAVTGLPGLNPNLVDAGNSNYKYMLGTSPTFTYKGFSLTAVFDYRGGAKILNEEGNVMDFAGISTSDAVNRQAFVIPNSVINTAPQGAKPNYVANTNIPISGTNSGTPVGYYFWTNYYSQIGMPYVTNAAFVKLREIVLSYELPKSALGSMKTFKAVTFSLLARNVFMWRPKTNIWSDPEFSTNGIGNAVGYTTEFQTPPTRILSATISATIF